MASRSKHNTPIMKYVATGVGITLCGVETWLNAEHIAKTEGLVSSLVAAVVVASIGAAAALPLAERAAKASQKAKALGLALFFLLMVCFSFSASVDRVGGKKDGEIAAARTDNNRVALAREAYTTAQKAAEAECAKIRGTRCRAAEKTASEARKSLAEKPAERVEDSMAKRISAAMPFLTAEDVELYQPLVLPLALQLGGFLMLALGLSPKERIEPKPKARRKPRKKAAVKPKAKLGTVVDFPANAKRATK